MLNLPVLSAFAGLTVGCTPFLKGLLFGPAAPLGFLRDCLEVSLPKHPTATAMYFIFRRVAYLERWPSHMTNTCL